jgi:L-rhamnose mutarotase
MMRTHVFTIELKNEREVIESYKNYHKHIWPEVKKDLEAVGIRRMETYLLGNRLVTFIQAEDTFDPKKDLLNYASCERTREWDRIMNGYQKPVADAKPGEWWASMELVYDSGWE